MSVAELRALAGRPLFDPLAAVTRTLRGTGVSALNDFVEQNPMLAPATVVGCPIRFVPPDSDPVAYERRVYERGDVVTRPDNWHDLFNALVWLRFPRAKATLNSVHMREMSSRSGASARGGRRDAATQFDESGLVVLSAVPELSDLLESRRWVDLFSKHRADVIGSMRFLVFGHGLYDALRAPFYGLCGRAALIDVDQGLIEAPTGVHLMLADQVLAERFLRRDVYPRAKCFAPVPVLGIPGVTADSEVRAYYEDEGQFRPASS